MGGISISPFEGAGGFVVVTNVFHDFAREISFRGEDAPGDEVALNLGKPELNLIEPGTVGGGVMESQVGMNGQKLMDPGAFMRGEIIDNDMDRLTQWLGGN